MEKRGLAKIITTVFLVVVVVIAVALLFGIVDTVIRGDTEGAQGSFQKLLRSIVGGGNATGNETGGGGGGGGGNVTGNVTGNETGGGDGGGRNATIPICAQKYYSCSEISDISYCRGIDECSSEYDCTGSMRNPCSHFNYAVEAGTACEFFEQCIYNVSSDTCSWNYAYGAKRNVTCDDVDYFEVKADVTSCTSVGCQNTEVCYGADFADCSLLSETECLEGSRQYYCELVESNETNQTCTNQCDVPGQDLCTSNYRVKCGNWNSDECYEYNYYYPVCTYGCSNGVCVNETQQNTCIRISEGDLGYVTGLSNGTSYTYSDYCINQDIVMKYNCWGPPLGNFGNQTFRCSDYNTVEGTWKCSGGACVLNQTV